MRFLIRKPGHISRYPGSLESPLWAAWHRECPWPGTKRANASMCHLEEVGPPPELEEPGLGTHSSGKGEGDGFPKSEQRFTQHFSKREGRPSRPFQGFSGVLFQIGMMYIFSVDFNQNNLLEEAKHRAAGMRIQLSSKSATHERDSQNY